MATVRNSFELAFPDGCNVYKSVDNHIYIAQVTEKTTWEWRFSVLTPQCGLSKRNIPRQVGRKKRQAWWSQWITVVAHYIAYCVESLPVKLFLVNW